MDGTLPTTNFYARAISGDGVSVGFDALGLSAQVPFRPEAYVSRVRRTSFHDIGPSIFRDDIIWLANRTITRGCNSDGTLFCPGAPVTRGEMAAFLVRALALAPPPATDPYTDDNGHQFENDIESLAAAGITRGCNSDGTLFCPEDIVNREQMAAFLHR
jgi:hypothetical protein